jgi:hypothetical protein
MVISVVLVIAFGAVVYWIGRTHGREHAIAGLTYTTDTLTIQYAKLDTMFVTRTVRKDSILTRWDTVRLRDTLTRNDTVFVPRAQADTALASCTAVLETCEQQKANLTARLAVADSLLAMSEHKPKTKGLLTAFLAGAVAALVAIR